MITDYRKFFTDLHDIKNNQKYNGNLPYSFHLDMVESQGFKFEHLLLPCDIPYAFVGIWGHDSIEDARMTYNDLKDNFGEEIAEIIYLCTEFKGRNRAERKPLKFYDELRVNKLAIFVKLCDIIANTKFSLLTNSSMFKKYKEEYADKVRPYLYCDEYKEMFDYLDQLYLIKND